MTEHESIHYLTLGELASRLESRVISPVEVTRQMLERIDRLDGSFNSYTTVLPESALETARQAEDEIGRGSWRGPLHGIPVAVKDLCATKGVRTTCGTRVYRDWMPDHDACVIEKLRDAGAVLLGKLAMTEGASSEHHPDVAPPQNPWDAARWTGVSSSGSSVATAAGLCFAALGSDTGGSIRCPSACCGLVGLKPTYGLVSCYGVFPLAPSLDHVGPMTRSTRDAACMLQSLAGFDARDPASLRGPVPDYLGSIGSGIQGIRIGLDESYVLPGTDPEVVDALRRALDVLSDLGAVVVELVMPALDDVLRDFPNLSYVESSLAHESTFPARADEYGPALRAQLEAGAKVSGMAHARAEQRRRRFSAELASCFEDVDLIACPGFQTPAPLLSKLPHQVDDPSWQDLIKFTAPYDYSGSPTLSVPDGFSSEGLPLSLQLVARHREESLLFRAGHAFEQATDWHTHHPPEPAHSMRSPTS
ncbi:MAG: Asp-tRNA(Asn)/Glu-tRNA(Gln) amidotransferase GatCAB subunit A [Deltaproteobacteria bacterium]|nr:Asp-tRNA(Asn)/Glu-tRNA(Gln) amidotransferase GatCAB subunit A [Deltaproteobacteria bacterium]